MAVPPIKELMGRWGSLRSLRSGHEAAWEEIGLLSDPFRGSVFTERPGEGTRDRLSVLDNTMQRSSIKWSNFIKGAVIPSSNPWLRYGISDPDYEYHDEVERRLSRCSIKMLRALSNSNFYTQKACELRDLSNIGNGVTSVREGRRKAGSKFGGLVFKAVPVWDVWWATGDYEQPNFIVRQFLMAAIDAMRFFENAAGKAAMEAMKGSNPFTPIKYLQFCFENEAGIPGGLTAGEDKPWVSVWVELSREEQIVVRGYDYTPYIVARLQVVNNEVYGRGLGHLARPDQKGINEIKRRTYISLSKDLPSRLVVENESQIQLSGDSNSVITMRKPKFTAPFHLKSESAYEPGFAIMEMNRKQVREAYLGDVLDEPDTEPRSAEESIRRDERGLQFLSSYADSVKQEDIVPTVLSGTQIMHQAGQLPELDEITQILGKGVDVTVDLISPLFTAQKRTLLNQTAQYGRMLLEFFAASGDPRWLDGMDPDKFTKQVKELGDVVPQVMNSDEEIIEMRTARAKMQAMQMAMQTQGASRGNSAG